MGNIMNIHPASGLPPLRRIAALFFLVLFASAAIFAQSVEASALSTPPVQSEQSTGEQPALLPASESSRADIQPRPLPDAPQPVSAEGNQSKRILWVIPNYRAVSADVQLPPLSFKSKFVLASQDSFDYSSLAFAGFMAGISQAGNSTREFRQGGLGYSRYLWHSFADQAVGNYFTEFIMPVATHEDPRYYTRFHGGVLHRTMYALGRLAITRTDSGGSSVNFSEIVGNGAAAGLGCLYYPRGERTWTKTGQRWLTQISIDGISNVVKEFWPDIRHHVFRQ
jgi:hypothetical protein